MRVGCQRVGLDEGCDRTRRERGACDHRDHGDEPGSTKQASPEPMKRGSHEIDHAVSFIKARATRSCDGKVAEIHGRPAIERHRDHRVAEKPAKLAPAVEIVS